MTADTVTIKKVALVAIVSLFGLVAMLGCQTTQEKADAMAAKTPASNTAPAPASSPKTSPGTATPKSEWPKMVTIPSGTSMIVALQTRLRTDANKSGESFRANLTEAVRVDQMTVLPAGTEVRGQLTLVEEPHRTTGKAQMTLAFQELIDPAGDLRSIAVSPIVLVAEGDKISDEAKVASGAVIGGVIGALTSKKQRAKGAAVGAAAGAAAGGAVALATKGHQLDLPAGQRFEFELDEPLSLPVTRQTSQLQGNAPTLNYAALHPKASDQTPYSTTVDNRASDAMAQRRAAEALAAKSEWPKMVTIPSGTPMIVALQTRIRTDANKVGESFRANLTEAVRVDQMTVLPAGTEVRGQLTLVEEPHRTTGKAQMTLAFQELIDPAGDLRSIAVSPIVLVAEGDKISDEAKVASGAVIGGVIGALTSKKQRAKGAAVGAAAGAAAGGAVALATKGHQLDLPAGQRFEFELDEPLSLPVTRQTSQLQGNAPTPNYAELHPKATVYQSSDHGSYNDQPLPSTTVADRASDTVARRRAAEALAAKSEWPKVLTVPAGTTLILALTTHLQTDSNVTGDTFRAQLTEAVRVDQMTVFPVGTEVRGRLTFVEEPHRTSGKAQMTLAFVEVVDPAGFTHAISTTPVVLVAKGDKVSDEAKVGAGAVIGGIIGALSSDKQRAKGAAVGAAAGAAAGGAVALATKGQQLDLPAGQRFAIDLNESMRVSVSQLTASR